MSIYKDFDLGDVQASSGGMDAFFEETPELVTPLGVQAAKKTTLGGPTLQKKDLKRGLTIHNKEHPEWGTWKVLGPAAGSKGNWEIKGSRGTRILDEDEAKFWVKTEEKKSASTEKCASRKKVASLEQLSGFVRTASDTLVHKSNQDLWSLQKDANGEFFIERKFDNTGGPVKG